MNNADPYSHHAEKLHARSPVAPPPHGTVVPPAAGRSISLADVLAVVRHWWWQGLLSGSLLSVAACGVIWVLFKPQYEASAQLLIKRDYDGILERRGSSPVYPQTQLELIRSPKVLRIVAAQTEVAGLREAREADSIIDWLQKNSKATYMNNSEICQISFRARTATSASTVANLIVEQYLLAYSDINGKHTKLISDTLELEKERLRQAIENSRTQLEELVRNNGTETVASVGQPNTVIVNRPTLGIEEKLVEAEVNRMILEAELQGLHEAIKAGKVKLRGGDIEHALATDSEVLSLQGQLGAARARLREYEHRAATGPKSSVGERLQQEVQDLEAKLTSTRQERRAPIETELKAVLQQQQEETIEELQARIDRERALEKRWQEKLDEERSRIVKEGGSNLKLEFARQDLARSQMVLDKVSDRENSLKAEKGAPSGVVKLAPAEPPELPVEMVPWKKMGMASAVCLALPFGLAFGWERWQRRIIDSRQLAAESNLTVLGEITTLPTVWGSVDADTDDRFLRDQVTFQESVDALRVGLLLSPEMKSTRTLAVTSAVSREGKTSLSYALAVSLARCTGKPTLLIDADMRAPDLHEMFDVALEPGLAGVLSDRAPWQEAVVTTTQGVHLLPAGRLATNPHMLLKGGAFTALLEQLCVHYSHVIIDSPPVLNASEALIVASAAQATVVCAMRDVTRGPQLRTACQRLTSVGANIIGAVISGVPSRLWAYGNGGYGYAWDRYSTSARNWFSESTESADAGGSAGMLNPDALPRSALPDESQSRREQT